MKFLLVALMCCSAVLGKSLNPRYSARQLFTNGQGFIVGGSDAKPGEFPYQISYQNINSNGVHSHNCGGSIINENYCLIAAHCVDPQILPPNEPRIVAGMLKHTSDDTESKQIIAVEKIISHPAWNYEKLQNDIAILKLATPLVFNDYVQPTKLPSAGYTPSGTLTVSGWGLLEQGGSSIPDNLQKVDIGYYDPNMCKMIYELLGVEIQANHLCAGGEGEEVGVCNGDSGGPLVAKDGTQVGIVSFGLGCGSPMFPAVFANVPHFAQWIQDTISQN